MALRNNDIVELLSSDEEREPVQTQNPVIARVHNIFVRRKELEDLQRGRAIVDNIVEAYHHIVKAHLDRHAARGADRLQFLIPHESQPLARMGGYRDLAKKPWIQQVSTIDRRCLLLIMTENLACIQREGHILPASSRLYQSLGITICRL